MPLPFKLTAENVVAFANENNIKLCRMALIQDFPLLCARATLVYAANMPNKDYNSPDYSQTKTQLSSTQLYSIECGFEDWDYCKEDTDQEYVKLGRKIYELSNPTHE